MSDEYLSGFFDADGSISLLRSNKNAVFKRIRIEFSNTDMNILLEIQSYLKSKGISSFLSTKKPTSSRHSIAYSLSCNSSQMCLKLCRLLNSKHCKKRHRINTVLKYHDKVTVKNGKYSERAFLRKKAYERLFYCTAFY